jgi:glycerol-3-phosphate dehydrogenase
MLLQFEELLREVHPQAKISCGIDARGILTLSGECGNWDEVVGIGHLAAKQPGVKNVVNRLSAGGAPAKKDYSPHIAAGWQKGVIEDADILVIGAGISGVGIARTLSKYKLKVCVAEMAGDVSAGATKANNGNIHPGHAVKPGTLKAKLNVKGNRMYTQWAHELDFDLIRCGAMGAITDAKLMPALKQAYGIAKLNGVDGAEIVSAERAREIDGGFARLGINDIAGALWLPSMGLVEPYQVAVALAENAAANGVKFIFGATVADILRKNGKVSGAVTSKGIINAKFIINCAGVYADEISEMAGDPCYTIHPRKGVIAILDKSRKPDFDCLTEVYSKPQAQKNPESKGGGMCCTPEGNVLMGPSATEVPDKDDLAVTREDLDYAMGRGSVSYSDIIRIFAGERPSDYMEDFLIEMSPVTEGFINVGGIQSPGLAAAPAIAEMVEGILKKASDESGAPLLPNEAYSPFRKRPVEFRRLSRQEQTALIDKDPRYGNVICRCETITEGEILDALNSPLPPMDIDGIKRRTRAGMGRCQGGFCQPRILEILARETGKPWEDITLKGEGTNILVSKNRLEAETEAVR